MNIDSIGRIRSSQIGEGPHSLQISQATRVFSHLGGVSHKLEFLKINALLIIKILKSFLSEKA